MSNIAQFYNQNPAFEWERLERHRTEFAVTMRALREYLPPPPARILDVGGGPGRYAIALTELGHSVILADISQACLDLAREKAEDLGVELTGLLLANALDLGQFSSGGFDAALLMGPLYHLLVSEERQQAIQETCHALKPGGVLFASWITRFAPFRDSASHYPEWVVNNYAFVLRLLETGVHDQRIRGSTMYLAHPKEIIPFMEKEGLQTLAVIGCEGVVAGHEEEINQLQGQAWEAWVDFNYSLGQDPALHGASDHLIYIGRKPGRK